MSNVIIPDQHKAVNLSDITKTQLAKMVNELNTKLVTLSIKQKHLVNILATIASEPDAFSRNEDGTPCVDEQAVSRVKVGTQLHVRERDGRLVITVTPPGEMPAVEQPSKIIMPRGLADAAH